MKTPLIMTICLFLLTSCSGQFIDPGNPDGPVSNSPGTIQPGDPTVEPDLYHPVQGDEKLTRSVVYLDATEILLMESYPVQVSLHLVGGLPTPCHQLRIAVAEPDIQNRIVIDVYSVVDDSLVCVQMIKGFDVNVPLGHFPVGTYAI